MVQVAAAGGHLEAMLLLAEAGAAWKQQRGATGCPDAVHLYATKVPGCKVGDIHIKHLAVGQRCMALQLLLLFEAVGVCRQGA
jgi:hypothetical protein